MGGEPTHQLSGVVQITELQILHPSLSSSLTPLFASSLSLPFFLSPSLPAFFLSLIYKVYKGICIYKGIIISIS